MAKRQSSPRSSKNTWQTAEKASSQKAKTGQPPILARLDAPHSGRDKSHVELFGRHAIEAALRNPRRKIFAIWLTENMAHRLAQPLQERGLKPTIVSLRELNKRLGPDTVHQGGLLHAAPLPIPKLCDLSKAALLVALDQVTDPHNVGAVLRSCAVFGAEGLIVTKRNSPLPSGVVAKAASGALEHVPIIPVTNLSRALEALGQAGFFRIGLDGTGPIALENLAREHFSQAFPAHSSPSHGVVIILGAEGKGLRRLTAEHCDALCRISTAGPLHSLNVSNAAAVALHTLSTARTTSPHLQTKTP